MSGLRELLENLKELRELVRSLGRGGGRGPIRRAPKEVRELEGAREIVERGGEGQWSCRSAQSHATRDGPPSTEVQCPPHPPYAQELP